MYRVEYNPYHYSTLIHMTAGEAERKDLIYAETWVPEQYGKPSVGVGARLVRTLLNGAASLLAALAFDIPITLDDTYIEGISGVTVEDLRYARELGFRISHVGVARRNGEKFETRVHPALISATDLIGDVSGVANAVIVGANAVGSILLVGPGAGGLPTASAVLGDLIEIARGTYSRMRIGQNEGARLPIVATESRYYLNIPAADRPGVFGENQQSALAHT